MYEMQLFHTHRVQGDREDRASITRAKISS